LYDINKDLFDIRQSLLKSKRIKYMVGLFGKLLPLVAAGVGIFFIGNILSRPAHAAESAGALSETGSAIGTTLGSLGAGVAQLGTGVGSGLVGLLKPGWELKNLIYGESTEVPGSANASAVAQSDAGGAGRTGSNTITWSSGTSRTVPSLSAAAKSHYSSLGVSVS
jgi:hypothetical protein